jgi:hypothetical protein
MRSAAANAQSAVSPQPVKLLPALLNARREIYFQKQIMHFDLFLKIQNHNNTDSIGALAKITRIY